MLFHELWSSSQFQQIEKQYDFAILVVVDQNVSDLVRFGNDKQKSSPGGRRVPQKQKYKHYNMPSLRLGLKISLKMNFSLKITQRAKN